MIKLWPIKGILVIYCCITYIKEKFSYITQVYNTFIDIITGNQHNMNLNN